MSIDVYDDKCFICGGKEEISMLPRIHMIATELKPSPSFDYRICNKCPRPSLEELKKRSLEWCIKNKIDWVV